MTEQTSTLPATGAELVSVAIGGQHFAIDIMVVREIRGWTTSTPLPKAPSHVLGMINLRGAVLPVIDLGSRLGLRACARDASSVVIVTHIKGREVGLLVDEVCDIINVSEDMLHGAPTVGSPMMEEFVRGVLTIDDCIVTLLSLDEILPAPAEAA